MAKANISIAEVLCVSLSVNYGQLLLQAIFESWPKAQLYGEGDSKYDAAGSSTEPSYS